MFYRIQSFDHCTFSAALPSSETKLTDRESLNPIVFWSWTWNVVITSSAITLGCNYDTKILSFSCRLFLKHQRFKCYFCHESLKLCWFQVVQKFSNRIQLLGRAPAACSFFLCFVETTSEWWHQPGLTVSDTFSFLREHNEKVRRAETKTIKLTIADETWKKHDTE